MHARLRLLRPGRRVLSVAGAQGMGNSAMKHWRKAAKHGYRRAQLRIGEAYYKARPPRSPFLSFHHPGLPPPTPSPNLES